MLKKSSKKINVFYIRFIYHNKNVKRQKIWNVILQININNVQKFAVVTYTVSIYTNAVKKLQKTGLKILS